MSNQITSATYLGYDVDPATGEIDASCCCCACDHDGQEGHFACFRPPADLLKDEQEEDGCWRSYDNGAWRWYAPRYAYA